MEQLWKPALRARVSFDIKSANTFLLRLTYFQTAILPSKFPSQLISNQFNFSGVKIEVALLLALVL